MIGRRSLIAMCQYQGLGIALGLFLVLRVVFSLLGAVVYSSDPEKVQSFTCPAELGIPGLTTVLDAHFVGVWQRFDACWLGQVAANGYQAYDRAIAYLPVFPGLMRLVGLALGGNLPLGGLIVSAVAYIAAMVGLFQLVTDDFDSGVATRTVLYLSIFPTAFFLFMPYTEAVFLALSVWTFLSARRGRWGPAAVLAFAAGLTRMPGVLLAIPLAWEVWQHWRGGQRARFAWVVPAAPIASLLLYHLYSIVAHGWGYFAALATWQNRQAAPWTAFAASWRYIQQRGQPVELINLGSLLVFLVLLLAGARRLPFSYTAYAGAQWLLVACRLCGLSPLMSSARYLLVVFPAFVVLALVLPRLWQRSLWFAGSLLLLLFLTWAVVLGNFAG